MRVVFLFFVVVFSGNPGNCPNAFSSGNKCDINCCVSTLMPGLPFDKYGNQEPFHRLGYWNEDLAQDTMPQCGYCYLRFNRGGNNNHVKDLMHICPHWFVEERPHGVTLPDKTYWPCKEGEICVLVRDTALELQCVNPKTPSNDDLRQGNRILIPDYVT